jgi:hypothetical protein
MLEQHKNIVKYAIGQSPNARHANKKWEIFNRGFEHQNKRS